MRAVKQAEFERMIEGAKVLERQTGGVLSALRSADGRIIKLWQRRTGLSSDLLSPYSKRFADNCVKLNERGIPAPTIVDRFRILESGEHVLIYPMLPGASLADLAKQNALPVDALAEFYAQLHAAGVLFRSIHLGNVLQLDDGRMGLIDVTDCWFHSRALGSRRRGQNLGYAWAYGSDNVHFGEDIRERMLGRYLAVAGLSKGKTRRFKAELEEAYTHYTARRKKRNAEHRARKAKLADS